MASVLRVTTLLLNYHKLWFKLLLLLFFCYCCCRAQNMKKHFHPLTMENLERVWKAEEKKRLEEERITQLQSELQEERRREELQQQAVQSGLVKYVNCFDD